MKYAYACNVFVEWYADKKKREVEKQIKRELEKMSHSNFSIKKH